jgi:ribosomal protein S18 acetylase RimI-like enzyme
VTLVIRRAQTEDADFVAWAILAAQRGHRRRGWFDIALDRPEPECLAFVRQIALSPTRSWCHLSHFLIAEVEGRCAAALCALPVAGTIAALRGAIEEAALALRLDAADHSALWRRGAYAAHCWMAGESDAWMIEHVATKPERRGRGLASALLAHAMTIGADNGYKRAQITFYIGNGAAERRYAKAGFEFAEERRHAEFEALTGAPGFRRYARDLNKA